MSLRALYRITKLWMMMMIFLVRRYLGLFYFDASSVQYIHEESTVMPFYPQFFICTRPVGLIISYFITENSRKPNTQGLALSSNEVVVPEGRVNSNDPGYLSESRVPHSGSAAL